MGITGERLARDAPAFLRQFEGTIGQALGVPRTGTTKLEALPAGEAYPAADWHAAHGRTNHASCACRISVSISVSLRSQPDESLFLFMQDLCQRATTECPGHYAYSVRKTDKDTRTHSSDSKSD
jgi:hypothetical protein